MKDTDPEFWDRRYRAGGMPWDFGGLPAALTGWLETERPGRVLIPGCGSGYEIRSFHERGWDVTAVDFSPAAIERAPKDCGELLLANFFAYDFGRRTFDVIYERTFLCSLPPKIWPKYAERMAELLVAGGKLIGFFLYGHEDQPPPYPLPAGAPLFDADFRRIVDEPVTDSLPLFAGRERWQVWERRHAKGR